MVRVQECPGRTELRHGRFLTKRLVDGLHSASSLLRLTAALPQTREAQDRAELEHSAALPARHINRTRQAGFRRLQVARFADPRFAGEAVQLRLVKPIVVPFSDEEALRQDAS